MSWDSYIDDLIAQTKDASGAAHADRACIIAIDGGAKWTTDGHPRALKLSPMEASYISECFKKKDFTAFMTTGILAESIWYLFSEKMTERLSSERGKVAVQSLYSLQRQPS